VIQPEYLYDEMMQVVLHAEYSYCVHDWQLPEETCRNLRFSNVKVGLDMEYKFISNRRVHVKQIREFHGSFIIFT
jgi:hypothetical protein